jgi:hypothetical protein
MQASHRRRCASILVLLVLSTPAPAPADESVIDKVYHPYVQAMEREIEVRTTIENGAERSRGDRNLLRTGYGRALNDRWFGEAYLVSEYGSGGGFDLRSFEAEALWQLTEQGQYFADWGLLFEAEKTRKQDSGEVAAALLVEKEWGRWSGTANLYGMYEFGAGVHDEFETALKMQVRLRQTVHFEPALELYAGQNTRGIGPVALGSQPLGPARRLHWEAGLIFGLDDDTPDTTIRAAFEYEF